MAGDWIKIEMILPEKAEVFRIADLLQMDRWAVVGRLVKLWSWAQSITTDGNARSVTPAHVDVTLGAPGFADALVRVGWLEVDSGGIVFPRFEVHNSEGAKKRALTARRVAKHRSGRCNANVTLPALPEKRREDNIPPTPQGGTASKGGGKRNRTPPLRNDGPTPNLRPASSPAPLRCPKGHAMAARQDGSPYCPFCEDSARVA